MWCQFYTTCPPVSASVAFYTYTLSLTVWRFTLTPSLSDGVASVSHTCLAASVAFCTYTLSLSDSVAFHTYTLSVTVWRFTPTPSLSDSVVFYT